MKNPITTYEKFREVRSIRVSRTWKNRSCCFCDAPKARWAVNLKLWDFRVDWTWYNSFTNKVHETFKLGVCHKCASGRHDAAQRVLMDIFGDLRIYTNPRAYAIVSDGLCAAFMGMCAGVSFTSGPDLSGSLIGLWILLFVLRDIKTNAYETILNSAKNATEAYRHGAIRGAQIVNEAKKTSDKA